MLESGRPSAKSTAPQRLRSATRTLHEDLEGRINWSEALSSLHAYARLLRQIHRIQMPADRLFQQHLTPGPAAGADRRSAAWLERDLAWVAAHGGPDLGGLPPAVDLGWADSPAAACGVLYVLEGSTLGAAVLAKQAKENLGVAPEAGCEYLSAYGKQTMERWRQTQSWLEQQLSEEADIVAAESAAQAAFAAYASAMEGAA